MNKTTPDRDPGFGRFLNLLGELNYSWTNTESLLIHAIAGLAKVDKDVAVVIFLTLNTTRARIDLVERLAKLPNVSADARDEILGLTSRLQSLSRLRNRYNHCIYSFDSQSGSARTILMRILDRKTDIKMGQVDNLDDDALRDLERTISDLGELNRAFWEYFAKSQSV